MSSSPVTPYHWSMWLGDMPMPEGATFDEMMAAYDAVKKIEDKDYAVEQLKWYEDSWRRYLPRYEAAKAVKDEGDEFLEKFNTLESIMKLIKEGIEMMRERINE